ncbi:unnamed protein product [Natator depressus]
MMSNRVSGRLKHKARFSKKQRHRHLHGSLHQHQWPHAFCTPGMKAALKGLKGARRQDENEVREEESQEHLKCRQVYLEQTVTALHAAESREVFVLVCITVRGKLLHC